MEHMTTVHQKCNECTNIFSNSAELMDHKTSKHVVSCDICEEKFTSKIALKGHEEKHEGTKKVVRALHSNIKELPVGVKCLHPDSYEYCVPGDGACCLNCLAAWIYGDYTKGPRESRNLNTHLGEYR